MDPEGGSFCTHSFERDREPVGYVFDAHACVIPGRKTEMQDPPSQRDLFEALVNRNDESRPSWCPRNHLVFLMFQGLPVCPDYWFSLEAMDIEICPHTTKSYGTGGRGPEGWLEQVNREAESAAQLAEKERALKLGKLQLYEIGGDYPTRPAEFCLATILGFLQTAIRLESKTMLDGGGMALTNLPWYEHFLTNVVSSDEGRFTTPACKDVLTRDTTYAAGRLKELALLEVVDHVDKNILAQKAKGPYEEFPFGLNYAGKEQLQLLESTSSRT